MTQYLIKTITHDTGEVFPDVIKAREKAKWPKGLLEVVPSPFNDNPISRALSKSQRGPSRRDIEHYGE